MNSPNLFGYDVLTRTFGLVVIIWREPNSEVDFLSRESNRDTEWSLPNAIFQKKKSKVILVFVILIYLHLRKSIKLRHMLR